MILISMAGLWGLCLSLQEIQVHPAGCSLFRHHLGGSRAGAIHSCVDVACGGVPLFVALPIPHFDNPLMWFYVVGFAAMLAVINVIEQVMGNAAI